MNILIQITLFLVIILSLLFFLRGKLTALAASGPGALFAICLILTLSALFWATPFRFLAGWGLQKAGVHQAIQSTDETLDSYNPNTIYQEKKEAAQETAGNLLQSVKDRFWSSESDPESESDSSPENQETSELNDQATKKLEPGFLEKNLYPQLVSFFTGIIRLIAVLLGLIGLGLATYLGYITQSLRQTQQLSRRCSKLEKEMAELKKKAALEN